MFVRRVARLPVSREPFVCVFCIANEPFRVPQRAFASIRYVPPRRRKSQNSVSDVRRFVTTTNVDSHQSQVQEESHGSEEKEECLGGKEEKGPQWSEEEKASPGSGEKQSSQHVGKKEASQKSKKKKESRKRKGKELSADIETGKIIPRDNRKKTSTKTKAKKPTAKGNGKGTHSGAKRRSRISDADVEEAEIVAEQEENPQKGVKSARKIKGTKIRTVLTGKAKPGEPEEAMEAAPKGKNIITQKPKKTTTEKAKNATTKKVEKSAPKKAKKEAARKVKDVAPKVEDSVAPKSKDKASPLPSAVGASLAAMGMPLKEAMTGHTEDFTKHKVDVVRLSAEDLDFQPLDVESAPVPMLAHGLDRVLFNPGVYRLQDPRSRVYNFDPYLEKIMPVREFDFGAISRYQTSSKDETLLAIAREQQTKFTGSTSSMSGSLVHFHYLLSQWRRLNTDHLSKGFPVVSNNFTNIQKAPSAIFLRYRNGVYAIDADKEFDSPNIMSWLGNSLELLLTSSVPDFERYRRSSTEATPSEDEHGRSYHYSKLGNVLMRSQLDTHDPRLPGTGVFDLKTRAVVSIRMGASNYEQGLGYQLHYDHGEWESFEREYFDMMRATMLKYSLQVRMGRMDGIFIAFHNIERIFGFQYVPLTDMDLVLHGQADTCLGDQEFKFSVQLMSELLELATQKFPEQTIRFHFETREGQVPFMYIFAEPVTEEEAEAIQSKGSEAALEFERTVIGIDSEDSRSQAEWEKIQERVEEEMEDDKEEIESDKEELEGDKEEIEGDKEDQEERLENLEEPVLMDNGVISSVAEYPQQDSQILDGISEEEPTSGLPVEEMADEAAASEEESAESDTTNHIDGARESIEGDRADKKPLMGWTLTIRNRVNGRYVARPENLTPDDNWNIEYAITEIPEERRGSLYGTIKARRRKLLSFQKAAESKSWERYREIIDRYTKKGRQWRATQDSIDEKLGLRVYRRLGPGSEQDD